MKYKWRARFALLKETAPILYLAAVMGILSTVSSLHLRWAGWPLDKAPQSTLRSIQANSPAKGDGNA